MPSRLSNTELTYSVSKSIDLDLIFVYGNLIALSNREIEIDMYVDLDI